MFEKQQNARKFTQLKKKNELNNWQSENSCSSMASKWCGFFFSICMLFNLYNSKWMLDRYPFIIGLLVNCFLPQSNLQRNWKLIKWSYILLVIMSGLHRNNAAVCSLQSALCLWPTLFYQWVFFSLVVEAKTQNFSAIQGENVHNCSNCILVLSSGLISFISLLNWHIF